MDNIRICSISSIKFTLKDKYTSYNFGEMYDVTITPMYLYQKT